MKTSNSSNLEKSYNTRPKRISNDVTLTKTINEKHQQRKIGIINKTNAEINIWKPNLMAAIKPNKNKIVKNGENSKKSTEIMKNNIKVENTEGKVEVLNWNDGELSKEINSKASNFRSENIKMTVSAETFNNFEAVNIDFSEETDFKNPNNEENNKMTVSAKTFNNFEAFSREISEETDSKNPNKGSENIKMIVSAEVFNDFETVSIKKEIKSEENSDLTADKTSDKKQMEGVINIKTETVDTSSSKNTLSLPLNALKGKQVFIIKGSNGKPVKFIPKNAPVIISQNKKVDNYEPNSENSDTTSKNPEINKNNSVNNSEPTNYSELSSTVAVKTTKKVEKTVKVDQVADVSLENSQNSVNSSISDKKLNSECVTSEKNKNLQFSKLASSSNAQKTVKIESWNKILNSNEGQIIIKTADINSSPKSILKFNSSQTSQISSPKIISLNSDSFNIIADKNSTLMKSSKINSYVITPQTKMQMVGLNNTIKVVNKNQSIDGSEKTNISTTVATSTSKTENQQNQQNFLKFNNFRLPNHIMPRLITLSKPLQNKSEENLNKIDIENIPVYVDRETQTEIKHESKEISVQTENYYMPSPARSVDELPDIANLVEFLLENKDYSSGLDEANKSNLLDMSKNIIMKGKTMPTINKNVAKPKVEDTLKIQLFMDMKDCLKLDFLGNMPIHNAILDNNVSYLRRQCVVLKLRQVSVNIENNQGLTPLQMAIMSNCDLQIVSTLLQYGADINVRDSEGNTLLHLIVMHSTEIILQEVLKYCQMYLINIKNDEGLTALMLATMETKACMVEVLLKFGADPNLRDEKSGRTALFHAVEIDSHIIINLLLKSKANPKIRNFFGLTALDAAKDLELPEVNILEVDNTQSIQPAYKRSIMSNNSQNNSQNNGSKKSKFSFTPSYKKVDIKNIQKPKGTWKRK